MKLVNILPFGYKDVLTYSVPKKFQDKIKLGQSVIIPYGKKEREGIVLSFEKNKPSFLVKEVKTIKNVKPILSNLQIHLINLLSNYYFSSASLAYKNVIPSYSTQEKIKNNSVDNTSDNNRYILNKKSVNTEIIKISKEALEKKKQALILFPNQRELETFAQKERTFIEKSNVIVSKSSNSLKEKKETWSKIAKGEVLLILGTRSSLFLPFQNIGLIFIKQSYDNSYNQEKIPRYNAAKVAEEIQSITKCNLILHSETINYKDIFRLKNDDYKKISTDENRETKINIAAEPVYPIIGINLEKNIKEAISKNKKVAFFINQKGEHTASYCLDCGDISRCPNCNTTLKPTSKNLECNTCQHKELIPLKCKKCSGTNIKSIGVGIKKVAEEIRKIFKEETVLEINSENIDKTDKKEMQTCNIVVGTSSIKNTINDKFGLLVIMYPENIMNLPTHSAILKSQILFSSLISRIPEEATIITKTTQQDAEIWENLTNVGFIEKEMVSLKKFSYPPFGDLIEIEIEGKNQERIITKLEKIFEKYEPTLREEGSKKIMLFKTEKSKVVYDTILRQITGIKITRNPELNI